MNKGGFSWNRLLGISAAKSRVSRKIGIPLTKSGRQRKYGAAMGCATLVISGILLLAAISITCAGLAKTTKSTATSVSTSAGSETSGKDATLSILPTREDFAGKAMPLDVRWPMSSLGLSPVMKRLRVSNKVMAGVSSGPRSRDNDDWFSRIRFVVYKTPSDARNNAGREDADEPTGGMEQPDDIGCVRKFVQDNVSVTIRIIVQRVPEKEEDQQQLHQKLGKLADMLQQSITKRIDRVVAAKGKVDGANLPPVEPIRPAKTYKDSGKTSQR